MVNSIFCDCRFRQLSTSVRYTSFGKRSKYSAASFLAAERSLVNFSRMFVELDAKINADDWHENDTLPSTSSFVQFLKWMIYPKFFKWTSIGVSAAGTIMVAWGTPRILLTADFGTKQCSLDRSPDKRQR
jgi:hypothetical protein